MSIPATIARLFTAASQQRGRDYYARGLVELDEVLELGAVATVQGTESYEVLIAPAADGRLQLECSCPAFDDYGPCKHLWATLLELDDLGHFQNSRVTASEKRPPVRDWERALSRVRQSMSMGPEPEPPARALWPADRRINYILDLPTTLASQGLAVELATQTLDKTGEWKPPKQISVTRPQWLNVPDALDRDIAQFLLGVQPQYAYYGAVGAPRQVIIPNSAFDTTLRRMCETGRFRVRREAGDENPPFVAWDSGEPWEFQLEVSQDADGKSCTLSGVLCRENERMPVSQPLALLAGGLVISTRFVARLRDFGAFDLISILLGNNRLRVGADEADALLTQLHSLPHLPPLVIAPSLGVSEVVAQPAPRIAITIGRQSSWVPPHAAATLSFDYGGTVVPFDHAANSVFDGAARRLVRRDRAAELLAFDRVHTAGFRSQHDYLTGKKELRRPASKLDPVLSALAAEGWRVQVDGQRIRRAGELSLAVTSGIDWFDLTATVDFEGATAGLPELLAALAEGVQGVRLADGSLGILSPELRERCELLAGLAPAADGQLRFARGRVAVLDALLAVLPAASLDDVFRQARAELRRFDGITAIEPAPGFSGTLRSYQKEGLGWLDFLQRFGVGGCLADDMGLGKTIQVLAHLEARRANGGGPSLVVVPRSLIYNWQREAARFTPALRVVDQSGPQRAKATPELGSFDLMLTTYGVLRRDAVQLREIGFDYVILDEAQMIKNAGSASAKAARLLVGRHRLAITGTPVENRLTDLWSLFEFLNPGMLGSGAIRAASKAGNEERQNARRELLARAVRPFILRRTKSQVAPELPQRLEQTLYVDLEPKQRKLYNQLRDHYRIALLDQVERVGVKRSKIQILEALLRLRQAACHPGLVDKKLVTESSAKLDIVGARLAELAAEGHKVLVFSQFTSFLAILRAQLDRDKVNYAYLDGKTKDRQARVDLFQTDVNCPAFLISLKAGGLGLNLTAAEYVFLLDPWWNPAVEAQAIDRAHRIGQTRRVFATRVIARDTVEEKVLELQRTKRALADAIITEDNGVLAGIEREDLELLLS